MAYYVEEERHPRWGVLLTLVGVALLVGAVAGGVTGGLVAALIPREPAAGARPTRDIARQTDAPATTLRVTSEESAITETVSKVSPGVVTLIVQATRTDAAGRVFQETNIGSGVVIDPRGYIVTNQHVVENQRRITVRLQSGEERPGVLVGDDSPFTDIAVVRVQPEGLTAVPIGDSDALRLGQTVLAIGSPAFGSSPRDVRNDFNNTVTRGIISGLHRRWPKDDAIMEDLIQTDAAVNHGNSGGALVNLAGELVGITTTVVRGTQSGLQVQGVAFAISSRTFKPLVDEIIRTGKVTRPYLGIQHQLITPELARQYGLPVQNGAFVVDVVPESPAAKAGIRPRDIIIRIDKTEIAEDMPYLNILAKLQPNTTVSIAFMRGGREITADVTVGVR
ncbi:MAG: 2-alkenal reductase [Chloroflexota bacterium]